MAILVTGGLGYIGSHVVRTLQRQSRSVLVVDRERARADGAHGADASMSIQLDLTAPEASERLRQLLIDQRVSAVIHLAALKRVDESVRMPARYYRENIGGLANVLRAIEGSPVRSLVFSSSAAVYGSPAGGTVRETDLLAPVNPYGETKLAGEWLVRSAAAALGIRALALRYFNVAGAGWEDLGDRQALNLLSIAITTIHDGGVPVMFGDDWPTPDGTAVRDYVHVQDLAEAHVASLDYLRDAPHPVGALNVGTGTGASVREVLAELNRVSGSGFTPLIAPARAGDPASVIADVERAAAELGWTARHDISAMVDSAWRAHLWRLGRRPEFSAASAH